MNKYSFKRVIHSADCIRHGTQDIFIERKSDVIGRPERYIQVVFTPKENGGSGIRVVNPGIGKDITHKYNIKIEPFKCECQMPVALIDQVDSDFVNGQGMENPKGFIQDKSGESHGE